MKATTKPIEIDKEAALVLKACYEEKIQGLETELAMYRKRLNDLNNTFELLGPPVKLKPIPKEYNVDSNWLEKARFIISREKKLVSLTQILEIAKEYDNTLQENLELYKKEKSNLSGVLKSYIGKVFIRKTSVESSTMPQRFYYGLYSWLEDDFSIDPKRLPDGIQFKDE
jgi:predicted nuclease with TOPRIM domain